MAFEHPSNLPGAYDRHGAKSFDAVIFREKHFLTAADNNEAQSIMRSRVRRVGDMVARDGDRLAMASVAVTIAETGETMTLNLDAGSIYALGDIRAVAARSISGIPVEGDVAIGIRLISTFITEEDDPDLKGLEPGTKAEGQPCAAREQTLALWSLLSLDEPGDFVQVYLCRNGTVIDQTPPSNLSQVNLQIANYDRGATGGNYIVRGCAVAAIGQSGNTMQFSIAEGEANIYGHKRTRNAALRYAEPIRWDTETVVGEPHPFLDGGTGTAVIALNNGPIDTINTLLITKQVTETITRGSPANTADPLSNPGATEIVGISQGGSPIASGFTLSGNAVNWAGAGPEPAVGSTYQVTYRYLASVVPTTMTADTITVTGGVTGSQVIVGYSWKLPRVDRLCLNEWGEVVYLPGTSKRRRPQPPIEPETLLGLADIYNDWRGTPHVENNGVNAMHLPMLWRYIRMLENVQDLVALERQRRDIDSREPVAKRGVFVDPLVDDSYRDAGEIQTAAVFGGSIQLAIDETIHRITISAPLLLDYVEEEIIAQTAYTGCVKINPYANFAPLPAVLTIEPQTDFWVETRTEWTSAVTRQISGSTDRTTEIDEFAGRRSEELQFLRPIPVTFTIRGFGPGETLDLLVFDGLIVTPPGLVGDAQGVVTGTFNIPAGVVAGVKDLIALGGSGVMAWCEFVGQGTIDITTMRRITTIETAPPPVIPTPTPPPDSPQADPELPQNVVLGLRKAQQQRQERSGGGSDPQAQSFVLDLHRHLVGVDIAICAVGDRSNGLVVELVTMENGDPTTDVLASVPVPMVAVNPEQVIGARWRMPIFTRSGAWRAFVIKTDDNEHSIAIATLGDFDPISQKYVSANPYLIGNRHSSSNGYSWDHHQGSDISFRLYAARFTSPTKVVNLGTVDLLDCSDLLIRATVEIPTAECSAFFEVERASGEIIRLQANENHEFDEYVTETVKVRAVLRGTDEVSPVIYPGVTIVSGKMRASGTYVTRAMAVGTNVRVTARYKGLLPAGSSVTVAVDATDGVWAPIGVTSEETLEQGWRERNHTAPAVTAVEGRIKLTITGTPAARPALSDLRAVTV